jgi:hypothetical protein
MNKCFCGHDYSDHFQKWNALNYACVVLNCPCHEYNGKEIERQSVVSGNIKSVGYSPATNTMVVEFKNGLKYWYNQISGEQFEEFAKTFEDVNASTGAIFAHRFKKSEHYGKLQEVK